MRNIDDVDKRWILERLASVADANIADLIEYDDTGSVSLNYQKITPDLKRAITDLDVDVYLEGRGRQAKPVKKVRVRSADKLKALDLIAKILGLYDTKINLTVEDSIIKRLEEGRQIVRMEKDGES